MGALALAQDAAEPSGAQRVIQFAAILLEAGGAIMIAVLFVLAGRSSRRRDYFETWTVAWYCMALAITAIAARYFLLSELSAGTLPDTAPAVRVLHWVYETGKFGYWVLIWRGVVEFLHPPAPAGSRWRWLAAAAAGSTLGFLPSSTLNDLVVWQAPVAIACCGASAVALFRGGPSRRTTGGRTTGVVLALTAVTWAVYLAGFLDATGAIALLPGTWLEPILGYNSYIDMLLLVSLGYAMLMVYMEDARQRITDIEARLGTLVRNAPHPILTIDASGRILVSNDAAAQLFGRGARVARGAPAEYLVSEEHRAELRAAINEFANAGEASRVVGSGAGLAGIRADGSRFVGEYTLSRLYDADVTAVSLVVRDVTAQQEADRRQRQASTMEAVRQLAGGIAHDFNNLLTTIVGRIQIVARTLPPGSPVREDAFEVGRAAGEAVRLSRELLALSRREPLDPVRLPLDDFMRLAEPAVRRVLAPGVGLELCLAATDVHAHIDRRRLEATLSALVQNAQEAMAGGGTVVIETSRAFFPRHFGPNVEAGCISVRDSGPGLSTLARAHLFEPFFSTKGDGRGLGLATTWAFAHQSGGTVDVESSSRGTVVRLLFPLAARAMAVDVTPPPSLAIVDDTMPAARAVLLAEDEASVRRSVRIFLERAGFAVVEAADGVEALAAFDRAPDDIGLLLTDVMMPRVGGRDLAARLLERRPDLPVVFMSGFVRDPEVLQMVNDRRVRFIAKPFNVDELVAVVQAGMGTAGSSAA
jgi:PAS domain S-box-containing protein